MSAPTVSPTSAGVIAEHRIEAIRYLDKAMASMGAVIEKESHDALIHAADSVRAQKGGAPNKVVMQALKDAQLSHLRAQHAFTAFRTSLLALEQLLGPEHLMVEGRTNQLNRYRTTWKFA